MAFGRKPSVLVVLGLALMTALALAAPAFAQGVGQAHVRVAHLSPDAPNVDVYVNGEPVLTTSPTPPSRATFHCRPEPSR